jgi:hypothetical protein
MCQCRTQPTDRLSLQLLNTKISNSRMIKVELLILNEYNLIKYE